jgi:release factor glutamine methyltransferase
MTATTFSGLRLLTAPGQVMTPRVASEALVASVVARLGSTGRSARVADVGTGSGAIAIAIASALPAAEVWATDTSEAAVALARANVLQHGLGDRVFVRQGDLLEGVPGAIDVVVANLPYLPCSSPSTGVEGEPPEAVFAPGDGLDPYRRLLTVSEERLRDDGCVILQLHRRVLHASRDELWQLRAELDLYARTPAPLAAAA